MSLSVTSSSVYVRFSTEVEPTDWPLNKAIRSLSFGVWQQDSETEVIETGTRLEMFRPDLQVSDGSRRSVVVVRTGIILLRAPRPALYDCLFFGLRGKHVRQLTAVGAVVIQPLTQRGRLVCRWYP